MRPFPSLASRLTGVTTLAIALLAFGRGCVENPMDVPADQPPAKAFAGKVEGTAALVGIITDGAEVAAYVCDGVEGSAGLGGWFDGFVQNAAFSLGLVPGTGYKDTGGARMLTGEILGDAIEGQYILEDGSTHAWRAELIEEGTIGGLFVSNDDEALTGVIVTGQGEGLGLSRLKDTGSTAVVALPSRLKTTGTMIVAANNRKLPVSFIRNVPDLKRIIRDEKDPPPNSDGLGTLMVMVLVDGDKAIGYRYIEARPDPIGRPTIELTRQLEGANRPPRALQATMRVRVLDINGAILSGQYIRDPLSPFVEVPADEKGDNVFWTKVDRKIRSFLVAVPNHKGAARLVFTRFNANDQPIEAGEVNLLAPPTARPFKPLRNAQAANGYDAADAEHATVVDNGPPQERFDLLIIAEGFRDTNADRLAFDQGVQDLLSFMWTIPIYAEFQASINVHTAYLPSVDSGANHPEDNPPVEVDTPFGAFYNCNDTERLICLSDEGEELAEEVAAGSPGNYGEGSVDAILVLVNDEEYGGAGGSILTASLDSDSPEIATHEFGHSAIGLADEYEDEYDDLVEWSRLQPNVSGVIDEPDELKWFDLVDASTSIPTAVDDDNCARDSGCTASTLPPGTAGMYEGAGYSACDSFRPTTSCHMRCFVNAFCPVCRKAFRDTLDPFQPPTVDLYMRDNRLDVGAVPSPSNVEDPPGSGQRVKPWQSVDIRIDAPPFGDFGTDAPHENPIAGVINRVYMTVHNRGTDPVGAFADVDIFVAGATGGAPPFPGANWSFIGSLGATVPGQGGSFPLLLNWDVPADLPAHTCMIVTVDSDADPLPALEGGLSSLVRNSNNITWKNLHIVQVPQIEGEISNFVEEPQPIVFRIEAPDVPVGTEFNLTHDDVLAMAEFEPQDPRQMDLLDDENNTFQFARSDVSQEWFSLRTDLPAGQDKVPFVANFVLKILLPGGTPVGNEYTISIDQIAVDPQTGILGDVIGGNTYLVAFE